jgi:hypothetical protein
MCGLETPRVDDAAPVPAIGFSRITMESTMLNYRVGHAHPLIIEQHFDTTTSNSVMRRTAVRVVATASSKLIH